MIITLQTIQKILQEVDYHLKENEFLIISLLHVLSEVIPIVGETIMSDCSEITSIFIALMGVSSCSIQILSHRCLLVIATQNANVIEDLLFSLMKLLQKSLQEDDINIETLEVGNRLISIMV